MPITCGGCPTTWTGVGRCHCSGCHRTFSTVSAFDLHRRLSGRHGSCVDPATLARQTGAPVLVEHTGVWTFPAMDAGTLALRRGAVRARKTTISCGTVRHCGTRR
jgi:hypothetical protein